MAPHRQMIFISAAVLFATMCHAGSNLGNSYSEGTAEPAPLTVTDGQWWVENGNKLDLIKSEVTEKNVKETDSSGFGYTPLHFCAVYCTNPEAMTHLAEVGGDVNLADKLGATPLKWAATYNAASPKGIIEALVKAGADPNSTGNDEWGHTPLMLAAVRNHRETAEALLDLGAQVNAKDKEGKTAYDRALEWGNGEIQTLLEKRGAVISTGKAKAGPGAGQGKKKDAGVTDAEWWAEHGGDLAKIKGTITAENAKETDKTGFGYTPLHFCAVYCTNPEAIGHIAGMGGDVNLADKLGATPLKWAATYNAASPKGIIEALVKAGADPNSTGNDEWGHTPLMLAAVRNHEEAARAILDGGADVNAKDKEGKTAYDRAREWGATVGNEGLLKMLESYGADTSKYPDEEKYRPASGMEDEQSTQSTLEESWWAANGSNIDKVKEHLAGKSPSDRDGYGATALHWCAAFCRTRDVVEAVLDWGADIHAKNKAGQTALMLAALFNKYNGPLVMHILHSNLARLDDADDYGYTALMYASRWGHQANVETLLELGANPLLKSAAEGMSARQFAAQSGHRGIANLLSKYERDEL